MKRRLLFVCLGNICRSPAAEEIFRCKAAAEGLSWKYEVDSAGTYGGHAGDLPDERMRRSARKRGYELLSRSRLVRSDDFDRFDMILAMDDANYERLCRLAPTVEDVNKVYRLIDFARRTDYTYIPDPYYEGIEGFERVLDLLEDACEGLLDRLESE